MKRRFAVLMFLPPAFAGFLLLHVQSAKSQTVSVAKDPGVRPSRTPPTSPVTCSDLRPKALAGLTQPQRAYFDAGCADFAEEEKLEDGLGPTMNLDGCAGCHLQPEIGGSSPALNPQATLRLKPNFTHNVVPSFITSNGPIREARFIRNSNGTPDGGVHSLFTIPGCSQENFDAAWKNGNVSFRIPTPVFGAGLIEQIPDSAILANLAANGTQKRSFGIGGRVNRVRVGTITGQPNVNGNDGTISRFGWKAQNQSLLLFSGEAYNVEMGISNELFPSERTRSGCQESASLPKPNDVTNPDAEKPIEAFSAIEKFTFFMRFLAPPTPSAPPGVSAASITNGSSLFASTGCALCHTPTLSTGNASVAALRNKAVNLYSDLAVHNMGPGLADGVTQGQAGPARVPDRAALGARTANLLPARRANVGSAGRDPGACEWQLWKRIRSKRGDREIQPALSDPAAGHAEFPAVALAYGGRARPAEARARPRANWRGTTLSLESNHLIDEIVAVSVLA